MHSSLTAARSGAASASSTPARRLADTLLLVVVLFVAVFAGWHGWRLMLAEVRVAEAQARVDFSEGVDMPPRLVDAIRRAYRGALSAAPDAPDLHDGLGQLELMLARRSPLRSTEQRALYLRAAEHQRAALALRPLDGLIWASYAESLQGIDPGSEAAWQAWRNAQRLAPLEFATPPLLLRAAFMGWHAAPEDVKDWVREAYELELLVARNAMDALATHYQPPGWSREVALLLENERRWREAARLREEAEEREEREAARAASSPISKALKAR